MKIKYKILAVMGLLILITSLIFSGILYTTHKKALLDGIDAKLLTAAQFAKTHLSEGYHDHIVDKHSVSQDEYLAIVDAYNQLCLELNLQYLWSVLRIGDRIVFTSATSPSKDVTKGDHASFFDIHSNPDAFKDTFSTMKIQYSSFHNEWGHGRMVLVPSYDSQGRPYCFGASISTSDIHSMVRTTLLNSITISIAILLAGIVVSVLLANSLSKPISRLTRIASEIADGRLQQTTEVGGSSELASLSRSINAMSAAIREKITELQNSRERLNITLQSIGDAVIATDTDAKITRMNPMAEHLTGWTLEEARSKALTDIFRIVTSHTKEPADNPVLQVLERGEIVGLTRHTILITKSGDEYQIADSAAPIRDAKGNITGVVLVFRDVTEEYRMQKTITANEEKFRTIFESSKDAVFLLDPEQGYIDCNPSALQMFAIPSKEELYRLNPQVLSPEYQPDGSLSTNLADTHIGKALEKGAHFFEWRHRGLDGREFPTTVLVSRLELEGRTILHGTIRDITVRKQTEEALKKHREHLEELVAGRTEELTFAKDAAEAANRAKSEFLSNMSHEFRTPLNGVLGYTQILKRERSLTDAQRAGLDIIERSGNHLLNLIDDILDLSKIEAEKMELHASGFRFPEFLDGIAAMIRIRAERKGLAFHCELPPDLPAGVHSDEKRLSQILLNLLSNAVKFTERGSVTFRVEDCDPTKSTIRTFRFKVEDTGVGIPAQNLEEIFSPFKQVAEHTRTIEGTGLGLSISRQLVRLMGSELHVTSTIGQGSTFWFDLELPETSEWIETENSSEYISGYTPLEEGRGAFKILVIDDKADNRAVLASLLLPLGFDIIEADDGRKGLQKTSEVQPDLVLLDLIMPVMDGFEVIRQLRKIPTLKHTKVIIVSASSSVSLRELRSQIACDDCIQKPVRAQELFQKLATHLALKWEYAVGPVDNADPVLGQHEEYTEEFAVPSSSELDMLYQLAEFGNFHELGKRVDTIEQSDRCYAPFAKAIRRFAKTFQGDEICEFIERLRTV